MSEVLNRQYAHIAGLALLVYDHIITWDKELNRIWRSRDWVLKIMFSIGRYGALAFQITNIVVTHPHVLKKRAMSCHSWFEFQNAAVSVLLINLQIILMLRVYALYDRSAKMACFLIGWFAFYTLVAVMSSKKIVPLLKLDSSCVLVESPHAGAIVSFGALCIVDQCILWGLTAYKCRGAIRQGLSANPLIRLLMRDISWSCLAICCLCTTTMPSYLLLKLFTPFHCLISSSVSVLTCRMILNMRGLSYSDGPLSIDVATVDIELTDLATHQDS